jgi:hypothetical protein
MLIPAVSRLAKEWTAGKVLRLNRSFFKVNQQYAERLGVTTTPTFILFDGQGHEQGRWVGTVPALADLP